jgi:formylglycine-generating enzyme required for sulfatase activity
MIYTFYSYKGGVGRSMAMANVGELFYQAGLNVLLVDWDLEAPGLGRFFALDNNKTSAKPGVIDMLLDYKHQVTQEWKTEDGHYPFKKPSDLVIDLHPNSPKGGLWLLTAGQRDKPNFASYANAVLTFDWKDFYDNWEGETYFEWLREQFLAMADVVLIDSRTGITEMGGVCTYQLGDVVTMFCGTSRQSLDGTERMVTELKSSAVEEARGRSLEVIVVPARVDIDSQARPEFREEFLKRFAQYTPAIFKRNSAYFWKLEMPYETVCAYKEMILKPGTADGSESVYEAFAKLTFALSRLAVDGSAIRRALPETEVSAAVVGDIVVDGADFVGRGQYTTIHFDNTQIAPESLREAYLHYLLSTAGQLSLSGIDPKATSERDARLSLSAVYTSLLTLTHEECERAYNAGAPDALGRSERRQSVVAQLDAHPRLVLLGDPGSGKSTFVNFVTLCLAGERLASGGPEAALPNLALLTEPLPPDDERQDKNEGPQPQPWHHGALLPVRVILRDFAARGLPPQGEPATARHLWDFIAAELDAAALGEYTPYLKETLQKEGGLLLLDGLDEVPTAALRREQIKQAVDDFVGAFPKCRVLVTSRTYAYQLQAWRLPGFAEAVLAPFDSGQIRRFVQRWYAHIARLRGLDAEDAQGRAMLLERAIFNNARLRALAERPLLLTLMASLHAWRGGSLPERREELYADMVDLLLDWWESPKVVRGSNGIVTVQQPSLAEWLKIDRDKMQTLLNRLAYQAHTAQPDLVGTADIAESDLLSGLLQLSQNPDVRPQRLLEYLSQRAGLLLPRGVGVYTFPQRTFQEYLAACYLTDCDYPDAVAELTRQDPNRWREIALLTAAKAARGSSFAIWVLVEALCYREATDQLSAEDAWGALLAGQILMENAVLSNITARNQPKLQRVRMNLVHLLTQKVLPAVERAVAGIILAYLGDPRVGVGLQEDGLPDIVWFEVPAGPFVMGSNDADEQAKDCEKPQHQCVIHQFAISRYPVTGTQYEAFVQAAGYTEQRYWTEDGWKQKERFRWEMPEQYGGPFNLPNHPAVGVSWHEAMAYCRWLTEVFRASGKITECQEIRLPSEAEWEKAARGQDNRAYPWGDAVDPELANCEDTGIGTISAVGCFQGGISPYGVEDMSGNMWEWTRSMPQKYPYNVDVECESDTIDDEIYRVVRGGAFDVNYRDVRCSTRLATLSYNRDRTIGFRVVLASTTP